MKHFIVHDHEGSLYVSPRRKALQQRTAALRAWRFSQRRISGSLKSS